MALEDLQKQIERAKLEHAQALDQMRLHFDSKLKDVRSSPTLTLRPTRLFVQVVIVSLSGAPYTDSV